MIMPRVATPIKPLRLAVLISGSGSGMEALILHQRHLDDIGGCTHITSLVISNKANVGGIQRATNLGINSSIISLPSGENMDARRQKHEELIHQTLINNDVEAVILSGYMRILSPWFVSKWEGRLLNIHPSLLPKHPGAHAHRDVLLANEKTSGCTVHFVDSGVDTGQIIAQVEVPVHADDSEESLAERIKIAEHKLYPLVIDEYSVGKIIN